MYKIARSQLLAGAIGNITLGVIFLFFPDILSRYVGFDASTNQLFRLFVSGVAIGFGSYYFYTYRADPKDLSLLFFAACLKYWAFAVSLYCYVAYGLSILMFVIFGIGNLLLAANFSLYMYYKRAVASDDRNRTS